MGKSTKKRQETEAAAEEHFVEWFASTKNSGKSYRGVVGASIIPKYVSRYKKRQLRDYDNWTYRGKSHKIEKQQIELIRHAFAKYRVPRFLEQIFISEDKDKFDTFSKWYLAVAQGESLYKTCTRGILSKKETHFFIQAPDDLSVRQAIWWARAVAISNDIGIARRITQTAIARADYKNEFWIDVHRFFTNNPVPLKELEELLDYVISAHAENDNWTIKKRSLEAIRRHSERWHRDMSKLQYIGGGAWDGMDIPLRRYKTGKFDPNPQHNTETKWVIYEIRTGNELAREGNRMRHCVAGYKPRCMSGQCAIFTMRSNTMVRENRRHLTIEVDPVGKAVVQARGLANRLPKPQEKAILNKWATASGLRHLIYI